MRHATIVGLSLLTVVAGLAVPVILGRASAPPASASTPCTAAAGVLPGAPVARPPARRPATTVAQPAPVQPGAAARPVTLYASAAHLRYSWRTSMVRWLGGTPTAPEADRQAAWREGWWGDVDPAAGGLARVTTQR